MTFKNGQKFFMPLPLSQLRRFELREITRPAPDVACAAHRLDCERLRVIAMVVEPRRQVAIGALEFVGWLQPTVRDGRLNCTRDARLKRLLRVSADATSDATSGVAAVHAEAVASCAPSTDHARALARCRLPKMSDRKS
jgi:hypothetical protein